MATEAQIAANRRNAEKSTGPRTPEGKAAASLNSLRHGIYAQTAVLPDENQEDFDRICDELQAHWQPQNPPQRDLVDQMAVSYWSQVRLNRSRILLIEQHLDFKEEFMLLDRLEQQLARLQRTYSRALKDLQSLRKTAPQPKPDPHEDRPDLCPGLVWDQGDGIRVAGPSLRGPDGQMHHDMPEKLFPVEYPPTERSRIFPIDASTTRHAQNPLTLPQQSSDTGCH